MLFRSIISNISNISIISERIIKQSNDWYEFFEKSGDKVGTVLVQNKEVRSDTVITITGLEEQVKAIKALTKAQNITIGTGYGAWKDTSYRIANFPAIEAFEIEEVKKILSY